MKGKIRVVCEMKQGGQTYYHGCVCGCTEYVRMYVHNVEENSICIHYAYKFVFKSSPNSVYV